MLILRKRLPAGHTAPLVTTAPGHKLFHQIPNSNYLFYYHLINDTYLLAPAKHEVKPFPQSRSLNPILKCYCFTAYAYLRGKVVKPQAFPTQKFQK